MPKEEASQKIPLVFFRTSAGSEPVRDWLKGLEEAERHAIGEIYCGPSGVGRWACLFAVRWEKVCGKCEQTCQEIARRAY